MHRQIKNPVRLGHRCRMIVMRPAVRDFRALVGSSWLRFHPRWVPWRSELDGVPVDYV